MFGRYVEITRLLPQLQRNLFTLQGTRSLSVGRQRATGQSDESRTTNEPAFNDLRDADSQLLKQMQQRATVVRFVPTRFLYDAVVYVTTEHFIGFLLSFV